MNNYSVTSSPHLRAKATTQRIMMEVCLALAPAGIAGIVLYGYRAAVLIALCVISCVLSEFVWQRVTKQTVTISDWSAVVTGLLLAYNLPANAPWWIAVVGSVIAIILVKQFFGGIGSNFMNPALTARAILFVSWAEIMATYPKAQPMQFLADVKTGATPLLDLDKGVVGKTGLVDLLLGNHGGVLGETCAIALIIGGLYLLIRGIADWRIPVFFIGTVAVCYVLYVAAPAFTKEFSAAMAQYEAPGIGEWTQTCISTLTSKNWLELGLLAGAEMALYQVLAGGLLLGAFFMATDYATSPLTHWGRIIFGIGCGFFLFLIRAFTKSVEGCSFAILFMNVLTPMIDRFTMPRPFGEVKKNG